MSNDELNKYKEAYSKLIEQLVDLHNTNLRFYRLSESVKTGFYIRAALKKIQISALNLRKQTKLVQVESQANQKELKAQEREDRLNKTKKKKEIDNGNN
jgi:hypothetical protein